MNIMLAVMVNIMNQEVFVISSFFCFLAKRAVPSQIFLLEVASISSKSSNENIFNEKVGKVVRFLIEAW